MELLNKFSGLAMVAICNTAQCSRNQYRDIIGDTAALYATSEALSY
jgi:hypothetical protein